MKDEALALLSKEELCVISTVSLENKSESAVVAFSENKKFEIVIGTSKRSRKFKNIQSNPYVSLVFGPRDKKAVQYEGVARELHGQELIVRKKLHFQKQPGSAKYDSDPTQTYILIEPKWMRLVESGPSIIGEETRFD